MFGRFSLAALWRFGRRRRLAAVVALLLVWIAVVVTARGADADVAAKLSYLCEGFQANYESFEYYTCTMRVRQGKSTSLKQAIESGPSADVVTATGTIVRDGRNVSWQRQSSSKMQPLPDGTFMSVLDPVGLLEDGNLAIRMAYLVPGGNVNSQPPHRGPEETTWNCAGAIGVGDSGLFSAMARGYVDGNAHFSVTPDAITETAGQGSMSRVVCS